MFSKHLSCFVAGLSIYADLSWKSGTDPEFVIPAKPPQNAVEKSCWVWPFGSSPALLGFGSTVSASCMHRAASGFVPSRCYSSSLKLHYWVLVTFCQSISKYISIYLLGLKLQSSSSKSIILREENNCSSLIMGCSSNLKSEIFCYLLKLMSVSESHFNFSHLHSVQRNMKF